MPFHESKLFCRAIGFGILEQARHCAHHSLSEVQWAAIRFIAHHPDTPLYQLASGLGISSPAATKLVDRLVDRGWAQRDQHPLDRRKWVLRLTVGGAEIYEQVKAEEVECFQQVLRAMEPNDRVALLQGLEGFLTVAQEQWGLKEICLKCGTEKKEYCILSACPKSNRS